MQVGGTAGSTHHDWLAARTDSDVHPIGGIDPDAARAAVECLCGTSGVLACASSSPEMVQGATAKPVQALARDPARLKRRSFEAWPTPLDGRGCQPRFRRHAMGTIVYPSGVSNAIHISIDGRTCSAATACRDCGGRPDPGPSAPRAGVLRHSHANARGSSLGRHWDPAVSGIASHQLSPRVRHWDCWGLSTPGRSAATARSWARLSVPISCSSLSPLLHALERSSSGNIILHTVLLNTALIRSVCDQPHAATPHLLVPSEKSTRSYPVAPSTMDATKAADGRPNSELHIHELEMREGRVSSSEKAGEDHDQQGMARMGKKQELRREFQFFSIWGFAVILGCSWEYVFMSVARPSFRRASSAENPRQG
ncbi:hypothetical protein LTR53_003977 [Teratosphaeriaceae sp. CCFEE 6253]|nr:hypothetical protein LTR53_003977 [Teratosphaeriaceae sp. CCFEE 6253]